MSQSMVFLEIDYPVFDEFGAVDSVETYRFGLRDTGGERTDVDYIPSLISAKVSSGDMKPGESIGERITLNASFENHPWGEKGTFWGKFRAIHKYQEGYEVRRIIGDIDQPFNEMRVEHFLFDSITGPGSSGKVTVQASDFLKQLNGNKAIAPAPSQGRLSADYSAGATSVTLEPSGVGSTYPASFRAAIGKEIFDCTISGDVVTLGSPMSDDHEEGESVQQTLKYESKDAAFIVDDLIVNFTPLDSSYTDLTAWQALLNQYTNALFSREIVKPTPVRTLCNELVKQAGLVICADIVNKEVYFDLLRPNSETGEIIDDFGVILEGSFSQKDQPSKRYNQVIVYFDKRDPFAASDPENFISAAYYISPNNLYINESVLQIYSEWIPSGSLGVAALTAQRMAARYAQPPRRFSFDIHYSDIRNVGQLVPLTHPAIEAEDGSQDTISAIITGFSHGEGENSVVAEEYTIDADVFEVTPSLQIDADTNNINLRDYYDERFSNVDTDPGAPQIIFTIRSGVVVGSISTSIPAIETGTWPAGVTPKLIIQTGAYVVGKGGNGGYGNSGVGEGGGDAIEASSALDIDNQGTIGGGGGGGGGGKLQIQPYTAYRGGGGAGRNVGIGGQGASLTTGGSSNTVGDGGDLGQSGTTGASGPITHYSGGSPGRAIVGASNVTFTNAGTILGAQVG